MKYEELPRACHMMLEYAGVEYLEEQHSPSMKEMPSWLTDEELGQWGRQLHSPISQTQILISR